MNFVVKYAYISIKAIFTLLVAHCLIIITLRKMVLQDTKVKPETKCGIMPHDIHLERTLIIFKPDVVLKGVEKEIEDIILNSGFTILDVSKIFYIFIIK